MAYSTPITWVAGTYPTAAQFNANIRDNVSFLANPPACRAFHSVNQSINNAAFTVLALDSERFDTDTMHDLVTNNSRLTIKTAGLYDFDAHVTFASNATGYRIVQLRVNGGTVIDNDMKTPISGDVTAFSLGSSYKMAVNDYVEILVWQNSGAGLNVIAAASYSPEFAATWTGLG